MNIIFLVSLLSETTKQLLFAVGIFGMKIKKNKWLMIWGLYMVVLGIVADYINLNAYLFETLSNLLFFILIFDCSVQKKMEGFLLSDLLKDYMDFFIEEIHWLIVGKEISESNIIIQVWFHNILGNFIVLFIVFLIRKKRHIIAKYFEGISVKNYIRSMILISMIVFLTAGNMIYSYIEVTRKGAVILSGLNLCMTVVVILMITYLLKILYERKIIEEERKTEQRLLIIQQEYYEKLLDKDDGMRRFRHDMNAHIKVLKLLYNNKKNEQLGEYIKELSDDYIENIYIRTDNRIADYFINEVVDYYKNTDFSYKIIGKFPLQLSMSDTDLCILMSNIMKNVGEALEKVNGHKEFEIVIKNYKDNLFINVSNSSVDKGVNLLLTDKTDKNMHGYGIKQIENIVKKYEGNVEFEYHAGKFHVKIFLKQHLEQKNSVQNTGVENFG